MESEHEHVLQSPHQVGSESERNSSSNDVQTKRRENPVIVESNKEQKIREDAVDLLKRNSETKQSEENHNEIELSDKLSNQKYEPQQEEEELPETTPTAAPWWHCFKKFLPRSMAQHREEDEAQEAEPLNVEEPIAQAASEVVVEDLIQLPSDNLKDPPCWAQTVVGLVLTFFASILLHKSYLFIPEVMMANLRVFNSEIFVLKLVLSAVAVGYALQSITPFINRRFLASRTVGTEAIHEKKYMEKRGLVAIISGSLFIGIGLGLGLSTPETALLQLSEGMGVGGSGLAGVFAGTILFKLLLCVGKFESLLVKGRMNWTFLDMHLGLSYCRTAIFSSLICIAFLRLQFLLWKDSVPREIEWVTGSRESPYVLGAIASFLQLLLRCYCRSEFDGIKAFQSLIDRISSLFRASEKSELREPLNINTEMPTDDIEGTEEEILNNQRTIGMPMEVFFALVIGGLFALLKEDRAAVTLTTAENQDYIYSFLGNFFQAFGAGLANGGLIGHMFGGLCDYRVSSFILTPVTIACSCFIASLRY